jgi:hypothetical protein
MKNLFKLILLTLPGCTMLDAYFMTKYDPNEYQAAAEIRARAGQFKSHCDNATVSKEHAKQITESTNFFMIYSEQIPNNKDNVHASRELNDIAQGLNSHYQTGKPVSTTFCKLKFEEIEMAAATLQHVIGKRPR